MKMEDKAHRQKTAGTTIMTAMMHPAMTRATAKAAQMKAKAPGMPKAILDPTIPMPILIAIRTPLKVQIRMSRRILTALHRTMAAKIVKAQTQTMTQMVTQAAKLPMDKVQATSKLVMRLKTLIVKAPRVMKAAEKMIPLHLTMIPTQTATHRIPA